MTTPPPPRWTKQVIVIRRDLGMRRGKEIAQGAHAAMAFLTGRLKGWVPAVGVGGQETVAVFTPAEHEWITGSFRKVVLQVPDGSALLELHAKAKAAGLEAHLITDSGRTEFHGVPTVTALAVGPDYDHLIDAVTGSLNLY